MSARLKLARTNLRDLEDQQNQPRLTQQSHRHLHRPIQATDQAQGAAAVSHFHVAQVKRSPESGWPRWKRFAFQYAYLPLFRWFHRTLRFTPPTQVNPDGSYSWIEHQGCYLTRAEADADAAKYPGGYVVPNLPLGSSLPAETVPQSSIYFARNSKGESEASISLGMVRKEMGELRRDIRTATARTI